jgi:hypothetical protein
MKARQHGGALLRPNSCRMHAAIFELPGMNLVNALGPIEASVDGYRPLR